MKERGQWSRVGAEVFDDGASPPWKKKAEEKITPFTLREPKTLPRRRSVVGGAIGHGLCGDDGGGWRRGEVVADLGRGTVDGDGARSPRGRNGEDAEGAGQGVVVEW